MMTIQANLLDTQFQFIAHQVNCRGVMGAGIALQIKNKYPEVYDAYKVFCNINTAKPPLGKSLCVWTKDNHCVINVFGQLGYGRAQQQTDYDALYSGFAMAAEEIRNTFLDGNPCYQIPIAIPYGIGCGLAGGDWKKVEEILKLVEKNHCVLFIACHL